MCSSASTLRLARSYYADVVPPIAGLSAQLVTKPDLIPENLTTALGCATATDKTVKSLCEQAKNFGGKYQDVYALAQSDGAITNFALTSWTQPVRFQLINPLLGNNCYIGTLGHPVVLNPQLSINTGSFVTDPNPAQAPGYRGPVHAVVGKRHHVLGARRQRLRPGWRGQHPG